MANASDIITYTGVPLAVLGVLPIFYTFANSFFTLRNVKRSLRKCGLEATTRGSYMAGVIEVSLPRYSITPLDRTEDEYWTQGVKESTLKGGTWTVFNWNQVITSYAMQRIQYSSDLKVPQAEVDLGELFEFLLDRGAVPDIKGIHMLRVSGLWTPTGTCLIFSPDSSQTALRISMPDDSDGILSLALQWKQSWNKRDRLSLAPGWMRLDFPATATEDHVNGDHNEKADTSLVDIESNDIKKPVLRESEHAPARPPAYTPAPTSIRFRLSSSPNHPQVQIKSPSYEHNHTPLGPASTSLGSLQESATPWLAPLSLALNLSYRYPTTFLTLPSFLYALSAASSIPCGVLVMANLLSSNDAPEWETVYPENQHGYEAHERFLVQQQAIARERILPEAQRQQAQRLRQQEELSAMGTRAMRISRERREREEKREREAIGSQKMDIEMVTNAALGVLEGDGNIAVPEISEKDNGESKDACQVAVEKLLVGIYKVSTGNDFPEHGWALDASNMLNRWREWSGRGGMNKEDLRAIVEDRKAFCWAAVAVGLITRVCEREKADGGGLPGDVRECLRVWKKVRLG
ncbi:MAG: hypothetical protein LQ338_006552 [Usnochroma carphineum]|nr:MAG: hypothetical protein LQ338_006552 [Usnochroma carphineum]